MILRPPPQRSPERWGASSLAPQSQRALYWLLFAAFNLLTLFLYQKLRCYGRDRGKDPTRTISRLVDEMLDDLARLGGPFCDTS